MAVKKTNSTYTVNGKQGTVTSTTPEARVYTSLFNPETLLTTKQETPGLFPAKFGYATKGRLVSTTVGDRQASVTYDAKGNIATATDALGRTSTYTYDVTGWFRNRHLTGLWCSISMIITAI